MLFARRAGRSASVLALRVSAWSGREQKQYHGGTHVFRQSPHGRFYVIQRRLRWLSRISSPCPIPLLAMRFPVPQLVENNSSNIAYHHRPRNLRRVRERIHHIHKRIHRDQQTEEGSAESFSQDGSDLRNAAAPTMGMANMAMYISS